MGLFNKKELIRIGEQESEIKNLKSTIEEQESEIKNLKTTIDELGGQDYMEAKKRAATLKKKVEEEKKISKI